MYLWDVKYVLQQIYSIVVLWSQLCKTQNIGAKYSGVGGCCY